MGTPTPPPPPPGGVCVHCDGILWPTGVCPQFVRLELTGLEHCPLCPVDAPNGIWWLKQDTANACLWEFIDATYYVSLWLQAASSSLLVTSPESPPAWYFFTHTAGACEENFANSQIACGDRKGSINGTGIIYWPGV